jgi:hypothetical protein
MLEVTSTVEIGGGTRVFEGLEKSLGGINIEAINNQWELWNFLDSVTTSLDEWCAGGGSQSRSNGVSLLVGVNLSVPSSPDLERGEHVTFTAHVTEGSLA